MSWQRFTELFAGWSTVTILAILFDDILWPAVMLWQGPVAGGITMFWAALLCNLILIWFYDKIKKDFLAVEALHKLTETEQCGLKKLLAKIIKAGKIPAFIAISFYDPFISVIYMRKGTGKFKMDRRDWYYFGLAMIIACVGWTMWWQLIIVSVKGIWQMFG